MVTKAASALALVYFASNAFAAVPGDAGVAQSSSEPSHVEAPAAAPTTPSSSPSSPDPNLPPSAPTSTDPSAALASTPPPSAASPLPLPSTSSSLDASSSEETRGKDFSHGLEFVYLNIEGGYQTVGLRTLSTSNLLPETVESTSNGAFFGAGAGLRLIFLTIGPRFRIGHFSSWNLWTLGAEAGIHLPLGRVEPYLSLTASYAKLATDASTLGADVRGISGRAGFGFDIYVTKNFTIGANASAEILALSRPGFDPTTSVQAQAADCSALTDPMQKQECAKAALYKADGSSIGMAATLGVVAGLHF